MTLTVALFIVLCLLNAADVYSTIRVIKAGGREANPILVKLFGPKPKPVILIGVKVGAMTLVGYAFTQAGWPGGLAAVALAAVVVGYGFVVHRNMGVAKRLEAKR